MLVTQLLNRFQDRSMILHSLGLNRWQKRHKKHQKAIIWDALIYPQHTAFTINKQHASYTKVDRSALPLVASVRIIMLNIVKLFSLKEILMRWFQDNNTVVGGPILHHLFRTLYINKSINLATSTSINTNISLFQGPAWLVSL